VITLELFGEAADVAFRIVGIDDEVRAGGFQPIGLRGAPRQQRRQRDDPLVHPTPPNPASPAS